MERPNNIILNGAEIWMVTRNFGGQRNKFGNDTPGFCVFLPIDLALQLKTDGWNIRYAKPVEEGDPERPYIQVSFRYGMDNPRLNPAIYRIGHNGVPKLLDEDTVACLDNDEIRFVDLVIRPYQWNTNGGSGIKAYVQEMFVTVEESIFYAKYFG